MAATGVIIVPIAAPPMTLRMLPFCLKSKTSTGILFSWHMARAVMSMTARFLARDSAKVSLSYFVAVGSFFGSGGVDAVHLGGLHQEFALQLGGEEGGAGVGGAGVAGAGDEDDDAFFLHVPDGGRG